MVRHAGAEARVTDAARVDPAHTEDPGAVHRQVAEVTEHATINNQTFHTADSSE